MQHPEENATKRKVRLTLGISDHKKCLTLYIQSSHHCEPLFATARTGSSPNLASHKQKCQVAVLACHILLSGVCGLVGCGPLHSCGGLVTRTEGGTKQRHIRHPSSDGLQPKSDGLQPGISNTSKNRLCSMETLPGVLHLWILELQLQPHGFPQVEIPHLLHV